MERWGVRERVCAVELFVRTRSITGIQRGFRHERNQHEAPCPNAIRWWVRQWREEALSRVKSHLVSRPQYAHLTTWSECWRPSAVVRSDLRVSTLKRYACLIGVYGASCVWTWVFTHKLQVVHALSNRDREMRLQFCRQFVEILTENPDLPNKLLMSDEAHFHLHGRVNKQNFRYWSDANPHEHNQRPTYDPKVTVLDPTSLRKKKENHYSHIATIHRDDQWISVPESSAKQWYLVVLTRWCYGPHGSD